jgi:hypothetical protein
MSQGLQWLLGAGDPGRFVDTAVMGCPIHVLRSNTYHQILGALRGIFRLSRVSAEERALQEAQAAAEQVLLTSEPIELTPQSSCPRGLRRPMLLRPQHHPQARLHLRPLLPPTHCRPPQVTADPTFSLLELQLCPVLSVTPQAVSKRTAPPPGELAAHTPESPP